MSGFKPYANATGMGGGGGYVQGGMSEGDTSSSFAPKKTQHTLRPVTIKQLLRVSETHADGDFKLDGQELSQVKIVAAVRSVTRQTTITTFKLEDGTGTIDAKLFSNADEGEVEPMSQIVEGVYVRVIGQLKSYREKNYFLNLFNHQSIQIVTDPNEITTHNLEVIYAHVAATRNKMHTAQHDVAMTQAAPYHAPAPMVSGGASQTTDAISNRILELLSECPDRKIGYHRNEIMAKLGVIQGGQTRLNQILQEMTDNGIIFETQDSDHFSSTY
ncbi:replication factor A protein 2 [Actinomortierella wolfii]|nr:replication factor A protein 2 [Actinomortierella wolfii]